MKQDNDSFTEAQSLFAALAAIAPHIAFTVSKEVDDSFRWDGDGPDPKRRGYFPHDVTVTARQIVAGQIKEGCAYLGGSYFRKDQAMGTIHGYLPQMLLEAVEAMKSNGFDVQGAQTYLREYMRAEYDKQRAAAGESVTLLCDGEPIKEFVGTVDIAKESDPEGLIYWLRNGNEDAGPFVNPSEILAFDPILEVNWNVGEDKEVSVRDPRNGDFVWAPLNEKGEIVWEDWQEFKKPA